MKTVRITAEGKPDLIYTKAKLEQLLRSTYSDTTVDLFLLNLDAKGSGTFALGGMTVTVYVEAR